MSKKVILSPTAKIKLEELLAYLKQEWSDQVMHELLPNSMVKLIRYLGILKVAQPPLHFKISINVS